MKRHLVRSFCLAMGVLGFGTASMAQSTSPGAALDTSIVIGVVATLSGGGAIASQDAVDGFQLALRSFGSRLANQEVRVVVVDDKGSADLAKQKLQSMISSDRVDMVLTATGPSALLNIVGDLSKARLMTFNLGQTPAILAGEQCNPWIHHMAPNIDAMHQAIGRFLAQESYKKPIIIGPELLLTDRAVQAFRQGYSGDLYVLRVKPGTMLFDDVLADIKAHQPDAVYSLLEGGMAGGFMRAFGASALKKSTDLFALPAALERPYLASQGNEVYYTYSIAPWSPDFDNPINRRFVQEFESETGRPATIWAMYGFDAALVLDAGLKSTRGQSDFKQFRENLKTQPFTGARGTLKFAPNQVASSALYLRRVATDHKDRPTNETVSLIWPEWKDDAVLNCKLQ